MKIIPIAILILIFVSCSENKQSGKEVKVPVIQESVTLNLITTNESSEYGERTSFDSLHFSIIRRKHKNGNPYIESITDMKMKIDSWKEYHDNGLLKKQGQMTTSNHHYIGKWEYYSKNGELDSIVDYDTKQPVSYFNVIEIAERKGLKMPDMEVNKTYKGDKMYWEVSGWTEIENSREQTTETILINCETGEVSKPEYQNLGID